MKVFMFCRQKSTHLSSGVWTVGTNDCRGFCGMGKVMEVESLIGWADIFLAQEPTPVSVWHLEDTATLFCSSLLYSLYAQSLSCVQLVYPAGEYLAWPVAYVRWIDLLMAVNIENSQSPTEVPRSGGKTA